MIKNNSKNGAITTSVSIDLDTISSVYIGRLSIDDFRKLIEEMRIK